MKKNIFLMLTVVLFLSACKKDGVNVSALGKFDLDPDYNGFQIFGPSIQYLEAGQPFVDSFGAYLLDSNSTIKSPNGTLVDSLFNNTPDIYPNDLTTPGIKVLVYRFFNKDNNEFRLVFDAPYRYVFVYKKIANPNTTDISGTYRKTPVSTANTITKVTDGVYLMSNPLGVGTASYYGSFRMPVYFYHYADGTIEIPEQKVEGYISFQNDGSYDPLLENINYSAIGKDEVYKPTTGTPVRDSLVYQLSIGSIQEYSSGLYNINPLTVQRFAKF